MNSLFALRLFFCVSLHLELSPLTTIRDHPPYLAVKQTKIYKSHGHLAGHPSESSKVSDGGAGSSRVGQHYRKTP